MSDDPRARSQARFGALADKYVTSSVHSMGYSLDRLVELASPPAGGLALDIATGGGHVALSLAKQGAAVIAADITLNMLQAARDHLAGQQINADYVRLDAEHLPFPDNALDSVTCRFAAHHFPNPAAFVRECARIVKPGGIVGVVDQIAPPMPEDARYTNAFEKLRDPSHGWEYSQPEWQGFFSGVGLKVNHSEVIAVQFDFGWWTRMQNDDPDTVTRLQVMLRQAPPAIRNWYQPQFDPGGSITFTHHHLILVGIKQA